MRGGIEKKMGVPSAHHVRNATLATCQIACRLQVDEKGTSIACGLTKAYDSKESYCNFAR